MIACIIAFVCLAAIFVKCIQKHSTGEVANGETHADYGELKNRLNDSLSDENEQFNIGHIVQKSQSRKHFFTGTMKRPVSPTKKYAGQVTPIPEDSQEQYNTGYSQKYRSQKSVMSKRTETDQA